MAKFVKGDVVVVPFPFSDLSQSKRRPALVIAPLEGIPNNASPRFWLNLICVGAIRESPTLPIRNQWDRFEDR